MIEVRATHVLLKWLRGLRDVRAISRIQARVDRLSLRNPSDVRPVGQGVSELRVAYGSGYRVYYVQHGTTLAVLLCGGDKGAQEADIVGAKALAREWIDGA